MSWVLPAAQRDSQRRQHSALARSVLTIDDVDVLVKVHRQLVMAHEVVQADASNPGVFVVVCIRLMGTGAPLPSSQEEVWRRACWTCCPDLERLLERLCSSKASSALRLGGMGSSW